MWFEKAFDLNDWVILISIVVIWRVFLVLPKGLSKQDTILVMLYGLTTASLFDATTAALSIDYYDIMDGPKYTVMDFVLYILYPPFAYFFISLYNFFKISSVWIIPYIFLWSLLATGTEYLYHLANVFQYKNGYTLYFSFCIYLVVQTGLVLFYKKVSENKEG